MRTTDAARPAAKVADDIGWFDVSAYDRGNHGHVDAQLDRIASEGALLTDGYGQARCITGRAACVIGRIPFRTGLTSVGMPGAPQGLHAEDPGKNHLGDCNEFLPTLHGFDELPQSASVFARW